MGENSDSITVKLGMEVDGKKPVFAGLYLVIVLVTLIIALLTTLSISAISTNGEVGGR